MDTSDSGKPEVRYVEGSSAYRRTSILDPTGWILPRQRWLVCSTLYIGAKDVDVTVILSARALRPGFSDQVETAEEVFSTSASSGQASATMRAMWIMNNYGIAYRVIMLVGEGVSWVFLIRRYGLSEDSGCGFHIPHPSFMADVASLAFQFAWPQALWDNPVTGRWEKLDYPLWMGAVQTISGFNTLLMLFVFLKMAVCWKPFRLFVKTMTGAWDTLKYFMITMVTAMLFVSFSGNTLFGLQQATQAGDEFVNTFDLLMNSEPVFDDPSPYREHYVLYYVIANALFLRKRYSRERSTA